MTGPGQPPPTRAGVTAQLQAMFNADQDRLEKQRQSRSSWDDDRAVWGWLETGSEDGSIERHLNQLRATRIASQVAHAAQQDLDSAIAGLLQSMGTVSPEVRAKALRTLQKASS